MGNMKGTFRAKDLPLALVQVLFELAGSMGKIPGGPEFKSFYSNLLAGLSGEALEWLFRSRLPAAPFVALIAPRRLFPGADSRSSTARARWRILKSRLFSVPGGKGWHEVTMADLDFLSPKRGGTSATRRAPAGRWLLSARPLLFERATKMPAFTPRFQPGRAAPLKEFSPAGLEGLLFSQAAELEGIRNFAHLLSRRTGRVVLSWHNATLAAAGGWAFEFPPSMVSSPEIYETFELMVLESKERVRAALDQNTVLELVAMKKERLLAPKAAAGLCETRMLRALDPSFDNKWLRDAGLAESLFGRELVESVLEGGKYEWSGALSPHQHVSMDRIDGLAKHWERTWPDGMALYLALASEARDLMRSGKADSFVLPWIDKFYMSSRRDKDTAYLEKLFDLVRSHVEDPLILFWEDTARPSLPSFALGLERMRNEGFPFKGLGIFDPHGGPGRGNPLETITASGPAVSLFALQPPDAVMRPGRRVNAQTPFEKLRSYRSSWKDNLAVIYSGTQVFPLLSVQAEMEPYRSWVAAGHRKVPFGAWFRRGLRRRVLGAASPPPDPLSMRYASWAALL